MSESRPTSQSSIVLINMAWKFLERIGAQGVAFVISIVLARLLTPHDYGLIAMVIIFVTIADIFVYKGLGSALIQKKHATAVDFSSVLIANIFLSLVLYGVIYLGAPWVASYFGYQELKPVMRVLGLQVIMAAVASVQTAYISRNMLFKKYFMATLIGTLLSAMIGILFAYLGYGVWALVVQQLVNSAVNVLILFVTVRWQMTWIFSFKSIRELLPFGSRILLSALLDVLFRQVRQLIIGKKYRADDLAYFNRGQNFPQQIIANINVAMASVMYPALSKYADQKALLREKTRISLKLSAYLFFPMMAGLAAVAPSFISLLLTDKWLPCVPYLQLYCFEYASWCFQTSCDNAIRASGDARTLLRAELIRKGIVLVLLLLLMNYGMAGIAWSVGLGTVVNTIVFCIACSRVIKYSVLQQFLDIGPTCLLTGVMFLVIFPMNLLGGAAIFKLIAQMISGVVVYVGLSWVSKNKELKYIITMLTNIIMKKTPQKNDA